MIVALTGGTGFVGLHVLGELLDAGHSVRALTRRSQPEREGVSWIKGTLEDEAALASLCEGAEVVVHVAGVISAPGPEAFDSGNRVGTQAMIHAARAAGIDRFVHISSLAAREPELSIYGASKRAAEDAVVTSGLSWQIVRPPAVYGPGDMEMLELFRMAKRRLVLLPPAGRLSVIHVDDLARLIVTLAEEAEAPHGFYEPDDGKPGGWEYREFGKTLAEAMGHRAVTVSLPRAGLDFAAKADKLARGANARLTPDRVGYFCHPDWASDPAKGVPEAIWTPAVETPEGLRSTAQWYRARKLL